MSTPWHFLAPILVLPRGCLSDQIICSSEPHAFLNLDPSPGQLLPPALSVAWGHLLAPAPHMSPGAIHHSNLTLASFCFHLYPYTKLHTSFNLKPFPEHLLDQNPAFGWGPPADPSHNSTLLSPLDFICIASKGLPASCSCSHITSLGLDTSPNPTLAWAAS